jgi:hypothetical protein
MRSSRRTLRATLDRGNRQKSERRRLGCKSTRAASIPSLAARSCSVPVERADLAGEAVPYGARTPTTSIRGDFARTSPRTSRVADCLNELGQAEFLDPKGRARRASELGHQPALQALTDLRAVNPPTPFTVRGTLRSSIAGHIDPFRRTGKSPSYENSVSETRGYDWSNSSA